MPIAESKAGLAFWLYFLFASLLVLTQVVSLTSCTNTETLVKAEILGYPQGAPLQVNCVAGWISCRRRKIIEVLETQGRGNS
jgi:hypothetical protein